jgi:hypothetical protein
MKIAAVQSVQAPDEATPKHKPIDKQSEKLAVAHESSTKSADKKPQLPQQTQPGQAILRLSVGDHS